jgi:hypothetical protein
MRKSRPTRHVCHSSTAVGNICYILRAIFARSIAGSWPLLPYRVPGGAPISVLVCTLPPGLSCGPSCAVKPSPSVYRVLVVPYIRWV